MARSSAERGGAALLALVLVAACSTATGAPAPRTVHPGAPGEPARPAAAARGAPAAQPRPTEADVRFMQDMIAHHRQALAMAALVPERSRREDVRLLARRIQVSQEGEIGMMRRWLEAHGAPVPAEGAHAHHGAGGHAAMPGMLTEEEMARLAAARGAEFDRLLLESMIRHHEGALLMVKELFSRPGAGQESEVYQFAAEVAGDQQIEIDRMRGMLGSPR